MKKYLFLLLMVTVSFLSHAEDLSSVKGAMLAYEEALQSYDSSKMADLMHPDALTRFRNTFNAAFAGDKQESAQKELLPLFLVSDLNEYYEMTDREAYRRLNEAIKQSQPQLVEIMKSAKLELNEQMPKEDVTLVVYTLSMTINGQNVSQKIVQELKRQNDQWLLLLPPTAEATIARIEASF